MYAWPCLFLYGVSRNHFLSAVWMWDGRRACAADAGRGSCFLVDGGSTNKSGVGQYQVLPYLKNQGISQIDGIFISHTDQDHISGVQEILEMAVKKLNSVKLGCLYLPEWENPPAAGKN